MEYLKTLLISANEVKLASVISGNVDDSYISASVNTIQEVYLPELIGTALERRLQLLVYNKIQGIDDNIDSEGNEMYKELLEQYVKPYIKYRVATDIIFPISFKIRNAGVVRNYDTNIQAADMTDVKYLQKQYQTYVDEYANRTAKYLCVNKDSFPELDSDIPSYFKDANTGADYANSSGLWLGAIHKQNCNC